MQITSTLLLLMLGLVSIAGWHLKKISLIQIGPDFVAIQYNTALAFLFLAIGVIFIYSGQRKIGCFWGALVATIGFLTLIDHVSHLDLGIDYFLTKQFMSTSSIQTGHMAPNTAVCFVLSGTGLLASAFRERRDCSILKFILGVSIFSFGLSAFLGYLLNAQIAYSWTIEKPMAMQTAFGFVLTGIIFLLPDWDRNNPVQLPLLVFTMGTILSVLFYRSFNASENEFLNLRFKFDVANKIISIRYEVETCQQILNSLRGLYNASTEVTDREFLQFIKTTRGSRDFHTIQWVPRIINEESRERFPVLYSNPPADKNATSGFDYASMPGVLKFIEQSRDQGISLILEPESSMFAEDSRQKPVFGMVEPVYKLGETPDTILDRRNHLMGFLVGFVPFRALLENALALIIHQPIDVYIYDVTSPGSRKFLCRYPEGDGSFKQPFDDPDQIKGLHITETIHIINRKWMISFIPTSDYLTAYGRTWLPAIFFMGSMIITLSISAFIWNFMKSKAKVDEVRARFEKVIETANDAFVSLDEKGAVTEWNRSAELAFGWTRAEALGKRLADLIIPAELKEKHTHSLKRFVATGTPTILNKRLELKALHRDGHEFPIELTVWALHENASYSFHSFIHDISERKETEKIKSEFISMVSHELRTPLAIIKESISIILDGLTGPVNERQTKHLATAKNNVNRLAKLINSVLDYQKLDAGYMRFLMDENALNQTIEEVKNGFQTVAKAKGLEILCEPDETLPLFLFDRDKIIQVLNNLLNNAIKFTPQGRVVIRSEKKDETAIVSVRDEGPGIKPEDFSKLFQSFSQLHTSTGRNIGGTGLGLAISKKIIEGHGGTIGVESVYGKGSTFYFTLPLTKEMPA